MCIRDSLIALLDLLFIQIVILLPEQTELPVFILQFNKHGRPNALRTLFTAVIILPDAPNPVSMPTLSFKFRHLLHFSLHSNMSFLFISMLF